ncbi:hypothetical protein GDO78_017654 [Eleutherodactylus coqui]|uniref:Uncharacterized protein n=1 Tax=Eleutherodactylus coqui TaxID=57060 RepID=A0A8J6E3E7_ELECQ|nr:hypothetical protein GDO78_017654 [Eleutherodactylus coqui]
METNLIVVAMGNHSAQATCGPRHNYHHCKTPCEKSGDFIRQEIENQSVRAVAANGVTATRDPPVLGPHGRMGQCITCGFITCVICGPKRPSIYIGPDV